MQGNRWGSAGVLPGKTAGQGLGSACPGGPERHSDTEEVTGAGVSLAPNGLRMLERLGVGDGVRRVGARYASAQLRLFDGRPVRHEPYQFALAGQNVGIHRADLLGLLAGQLPPGTVRTGHRCTGFRQDAGSATAVFADGTTATADVVIGADGIHSAL
jgi:salicylate hydroxylase